MKVWITKYALSEGIREVDGEVTRDFPEILSSKDYPYGYLHGEGKEWHRTRKSAYARADKMRLEKIVSLKKQIAKLEALDFSAKDGEK